MTLQTLTFKINALAFAAALAAGAANADDRAEAVQRQAAQRAQEERYLRQEARIDQLELALSDLSRKYETLRRENADLRRVVMQLSDKLHDADTFASRDDLAALRKSINEVDAHRKRDHENSVKQLDALKRDLMDAIRAYANAAPTVDDATSSSFDNFIVHEVASGENLYAILKAYNEHYANQGLSKISMADVIAANPGLNPDRIRVGQEIRIPEPGR